mgnify:CR=1 FL=1
MPFSSVLGASSAIRPGVVTSSTRPSVPYTGQVIYETDTGRLAAYNGSAWITQNGLQLITAQTIGSAVSSVTVSNCFSATYDNYKIIVSGGAASTGTTMRMTLGSTAAGYYYGGYYSALNSASNGQGYEGNVAYWQNVKITTNGLNASMELYSPYLSARTMMWSTTIDATSSGYIQHMAGFLDNATSYTSFTLTTASGTVTGGTIRVYGIANN